MEEERTLRLVLGDQLTRGLSALADADPERDLVVMAEVRAETGYVRHHPKKIALVFAAMRHFAQSLRAEGFHVEYQRLDQPNAAGDLFEAVCRAANRAGVSKLVVTEPGEWRLAQAFESWEKRLGITVEVRSDGRFLCSRSAFAQWTAGRKELRMENFYRWMRRQTGLLMEQDGTPTGGAWNYDKENRKPLPEGLEIPARPEFSADEMTGEVLDLVERRFSSHFGDLHPFTWGVSAEEAEEAAAFFMETLLPRFGDYQDAMRAGEDLLFHAHIAQYLNIGLLDPLALCNAAEHAYRSGRAPLNAVEGFIRQILGWREYVRGLYWLRMPDYKGSNALDASLALPAFYWTGETDMRCMAAAIDQTRRLAYAHHIQRLMVTGNFALLAGLHPDQVNYWYMAVYADAFEWVQLPNTHGMALFADGGVLGSKPYAASGKYIDRMSDYCGSCRYDVKRSSGGEACPFNYLYWDFIARHEDRFRGNRRMAMPLATLRKMDPEKLADMRASAAEFLEGLTPAKEGEW